MKTIRLDLLLLEKGLFESREAAQTAIMDGAVIVNGEKKTKPGLGVRPDSQIELTQSWLQKKFVSRGGLKLEKALDEFQIPVAGRICLDIGASTGGFTDCLLKKGAERVIAVDVGYGQLAWSLRQDSRVHCIERLNARYITPAAIYSEGEQWADLAVMDVSFISLDKILAPIMSVMTAASAELVCLIKPQFEIGKDRIGKGGVVRSAADHCDVIEKVLHFAEQVGLKVQGLTHSPVQGPAGNIEFLAHLSSGTAPPSRLQGTLQIDIKEIVSRAHT